MTIKSIKCSVVIPVWNPGEGISRCVASLRNQTLEEIEMIFVDDCGTDGAMDVVRRAAEEDSRIRILTNAENMGPGVSRNAGIEVARGEYLAFVDADDYVNAAFLERLYTKAVADALDIVKGKRVCERADGTVADSPELNEAIRQGLESGRPLYLLFTYQHQSAVYRRDFLVKNNIRYGISYRGEDSTFLLKACHKAKRFDFENNSKYYHCERSDSIMHDRSPQTMERKLHALQEQMDYIVGNMADEEYASKYVTGQLYYNLRLYEIYCRKPELKNVVVGFVDGIRNQVLRFPQLEKLKTESFIARVLIDHRVALAQQPFKLPWEEHQAENYVETIGEWIDFVVAYPNMLAEAEKDLYRLFREAVSLIEKQKESLDASEVKRIYRALSVQAERLPRRCRVRIYLHRLKFRLKKIYWRLRAYFKLKPL